MSLGLQQSSVDGLKGLMFSKCAARPELSCKNAALDVRSLS